MDHAVHNKIVSLEKEEVEQELLNKGLMVRPDHESGGSNRLDVED